MRRAEAKQVPIRTILASVGVVVAVFLIGNLLYRLREVLVLMLVGGFVALALNPLVVALQNWKIPRRGVAVFVVTLWALVVFIGLAFAFGYPLVNGLTHLAKNLPRYVDQAERGKGWVGHLVRHYHLQSWVKKNAPKLVKFAESLGRPALRLGKGAASVVVALAATFAFVILLLLEAPKMRNWILRAISPERASRYTRVGTKVSSGVYGYILGDLLTSVIAGVVVFVTLTVLSVPYALLWGLWVGLVDFLPTIGGALAGIPTVLFALTHSLTAGIVTAVVFIIYTQFENHVLNPIVMSRTVNVNPLLVFVSVLIGANIGDWLGGTLGAFSAALLAVPTAGALQVILQEFWRNRAAAVPAPILTGEAPNPTVIEPGP
jgi:predicted PurR-regulated permease PerM